MVEVVFDAQEYRADGRFAPVRLRFRGEPEAGWQVERNGRSHLRLGPGFRLLASRACGVCATDLARRFLPFPLPQVIGHELLAADAKGRLHVAEINASCHALGRTPCAFCAAGLDRHCPARRVLGIHDLPGGFGAFVLAPREGVLPVPGGLAPGTAVLAEPFAAAWNAVRTVAPQTGERVAVLGPRRLGMLVVAALAAHRARSGTDFGIVALARAPALRALARELGADETPAVEGDGASLPDGLADVVVDTTGAPEGLRLALRLARREVHMKSTHGRPAGGLRHATELVVDELRIEPLSGTPPPGAGDPAPRVAWLARARPGAAWSGSVVAGRDALPGGWRARLDAPGLLPRADAAVVDDAASADAVVRPQAGCEDALVRPRGRILVHPDAKACDAPLLRAVAARGLVVSTSRCGDFREALPVLAAGGAALGERLVTHRFGAGDLAAAFAGAASSDCRKAVVEHAAP